MNTNDNLLKLIHLLTPSEKKYFKQYIATRKDNKFYAALFDQLVKQEEYNGPLLARRLRKTPKQISDAKAYLLQVIMRSLEAYHAESTPQMQVHHLITQAEIAWAKSATPLAQELMDKAEAIAVSQDFFILLVSICKLRHTISSSAYDYDTAEAMSRQINTCLDQEKNLNEYRQLNRQLARLALPRRDKVSAVEVAEYLSHPLLQSPDTALSLSARAFYYRTLINYHLWYGDRELSCSMARALYQMLSDERERFDANLTTKSACLIDILSGLQADRADRTVFHQALADLDIVTAIIRTSNPMQAHYLWEGACLYRQTDHVAMGRFAEGVRYHHEVLASEYYPRMAPITRSLFFFESALCFYHTGHSDMTLSLIHEIEALKVKLLSSGVTFMRLRVLLAMMACDDRNVVTMDSQFAAARRHVKSNKPYMASLSRMQKIMTHVIEYNGLTAAEVEAFVRRQRAPAISERLTPEAGFHFAHWLQRQVRTKPRR